MQNTLPDSEPSPEHLNHIAWHFKQALHSDNSLKINEILENATLTTTKKTLLKSMHLAWQEDKKSKNLLEGLLKTSEIIDKTWIALTLSEVYFFWGSNENSSYYSSIACRQIGKAEGKFPSYLSALVKLWEIELRLSIDPLDKSSASTLSSEVKQITDTSTFQLIKGYGHYLLGLIARLSNDTPRAIECFQQAISFLEPADSYYISLAQIELAKIKTLDLSERKVLLISAQKSLRILKKFSCLAKAEAILGELSKTKIAQVSPTSVNYNYQAIGECLFISPRMLEIKHTLEVISKHGSNDPVLILGPKGSGKERIASAIQDLTESKMLVINCSNLSKELFESTMFGHKKGAFTGANEDKTGMFELVENGLLFLDEVGDIPLECQAKFLRVLQTRDFSRVGEESKSRTFTGRVIAATNKDLQTLVTQGAFRGDLLDRLSFWQIELPPLDKRKEEIIPLAEFFLKLHGKDQTFTLGKSAIDFLLQKEHPANIRGLEIDIKRAIVNALSQNIRIITMELLNPHSTNTNSTLSKKELLETIKPYDELMDNYGKRIVLEALEICEFNKSLAMKHLQVSESKLYRLLNKYGIRG